MDTLHVWDLTLDIKIGSKDGLRSLSAANHFLEIDLRERLELIVELVAAVGDAGPALMGVEGLHLFEGVYDRVLTVLVLIEQLSAHVLNLLGRIPFGAARGLCIAIAGAIGLAGGVEKRAQ